MTARFDPELVTIVGHWNEGEGGGFRVGTRFPYSAPDSPVRLAAYVGGRIDDYTDVPGDAARITRESGYRSSVAAPIVADGRSWGALFVFSATSHGFGPDAQQRLADFTELVALALESAEARDRTSRLAEEQAALGRVATLVASSPDPEQVFAAVAEEAGLLLGARSSATVRFDRETAVIVGRWNGGEGGGFAVETLIPYTDPDGATARLAREGGRIDDYTDVPGEAATMMREAGYRSAVAAPIVAGGGTWGALFVLSAGEPLSPDAEQRLRAFAKLVALALEAADAHDQLTASRARIVEASVAERRRLERNLHDGAQQRLVTLALHLRMAQETLRHDPSAVEAMLADVGEDLKLALEELRDLARGLHPAVLTDRGLVPALRSLANRAPFPVTIAGVPTLRLPDAVEAAVYYVVAESLTNAARHSDASEAHVELSATHAMVAVEIRDNGGGGASLAHGSGIRGLADRIEALGGRFELESPVLAGTVVRAELPLR